MSLTLDDLTKINFQNHTILIVDDIPVNLEMLNDYLEEFGFDIMVAQSGETALQRVKYVRPDIILLDVVMPDTDGFEICRRLKADEDTKDIPVIFMTALKEMEYKIKGFKVGAADYITKPFQAEEVMARVQTHLALHNLQKQLVAQNAELQQEIRERKQTEAALQNAKDELEHRVEQRTAELTTKNAQLVQMISDRQRIEQALRDSEARLRTVVSNTPVILYMIDSEGVFTFTEGRGLSRMESEPGQVVGQSVYDLYKRHPKIIENIRHVLNGQESTWVSEIAGIIFENRTIPLFNEDNQVIGAIGVATDVTEREQAVQELRTSEERFRQVVASISDHIYVSEVTTDGNFQNRYLSPHVESLTGYPYHKFASDWSFWSSTVIHPDDRPAAASQAARLMQGQNSEMEYRLVRADGEVIWVRDSVRVKDEGDHKIVYGLVSNITERKKAEESVRNLADKLEQQVANRTQELSALYDVTAIASESLDLTTTLARVLEQVLRAMQSHKGMIHLLDEAQKTLHLTVLQGFPPEVAAQRDLAPVGNELAGWVIEHDEPLIVPNVRSDPRAAELLDLPSKTAYVGVPIRAGGQVLGVLGIFLEKREDAQPSMNDITLLVAIADHAGIVVESARLRQQVEKAAVLEERGRLARELHDSVTQSLYSLTLFAEWGQDLFDDGEFEAARQRLVRIGETAQQALKEMRLLLYELLPATLEQDGLVGALQRRLDAVEKRAGMTVSLQAEPLDKLPAAVEQGLYRIAEEALNNALKHAQASSVTLRIYMDEDLTLEVEDNGTGFAPDTVSNQGGMGLMSMQERAEQLGAVLTVDSIPDQSTKVKVTWRYPDV